MIPEAHLAVSDGVIGVQCPYCGILMDPAGVRLHPVADPEDVCFERMSWESAAPAVAATSS